MIKNSRQALNNQPVTDALNKLNSRGKITSISSSDFSTLCTKIPLDKILKGLNELIDFCFKEGDGKFISVDGPWAKSEKERSGFVIFTKNNLKKDITTFHKIATLNSVIRYSGKLLEFQWVWALHHFLQTIVLFLH